jgi:hypothetical protein
LTRYRHTLLAVVVSAATAVLFTWPLVPRLGSVGRVNTGDGMFSIWNVAWVAHALSTDPAHLYDANIFYPEHHTLAYSEPNIAAGVIGLAVWVATHNAYATHNFAMFVAFILSPLATYALVLYLLGDRSASMLAAVIFAYSPFILAHVAHIQLLMVWGLPLTMLALHRFVDAPTLRRAVALGVAMWAQALSCAYYGILAGLIVGAAVLYYSVTRRYWRSARWWGLVALAAGTAIAITLPFFLPYIELQRQTGFARDLGESVRYSADWRAWLASSAWAHRWWLPWLAHWKEVLFPGVIGTAMGVSGAWIGTRPRDGSSSRLRLPRDTAGLYALLAVVIVWASFGPKAGLYTVLFKAIPVFSFLHAPSRFAIGAILALAVLSAVTMVRLRERWPSIRWLPGVLIVAAGAELFTAPLALRPLAIPPTYRVLAQLPPSPVVEVPFYEQHIDAHQHTLYMLFSTAHWRPLVNGYSDYASPSWRAQAHVLRGFPTSESLALLRRLGVRYVVVHTTLYSHQELALVRARLLPLADQVRLVSRDDQVELYELMR